LGSHRGERMGRPSGFSSDLSSSEKTRTWPVALGRLKVRLLCMRTMRARRALNLLLVRPPYMIVESLRLNLEVW
jgi:hypothetical protein